MRCAASDGTQGNTDSSKLLEEAGKDAGVPFGMAVGVRDVYLGRREDCTLEQCILFFLVSVKAFVEDLFEHLLKSFVYVDVESQRISIFKTFATIFVYDSSSIQTYLGQILTLVLNYITNY